MRLKEARWNSGSMTISGIKRLSADHMQQVASRFESFSYKKVNVNAWNVVADGCKLFIQSETDGYFVSWADAAYYPLDIIQKVVDPWTVK